MLTNSLWSHPGPQQTHASAALWEVLQAVSTKVKVSQLALACFRAPATLEARTGGVLEPRSLRPD